MTVCVKDGSAAVRVEHITDGFSSVIRARIVYACGHSVYDPPFTPDPPKRARRVILRDGLCAACDEPFVVVKRSQARLCRACRSRQSHDNAMKMVAARG